MTAWQFLRGLPGGQKISRRARLEWERHRPFPLPRYIPGTPGVSGDSLFKHSPPTAATLEAAAMSREAVDFVIGVLGRLTPIEQLAAHQLFYGLAQGKFGKHWRYADLLTVLCSAAYFIRPSNYLEIGVWRGRSAAVVGALSPDCAIYGFDLWIPEYGGAPNPGPEFVRGELKTIGHRGNVVLESGDSLKTLPAFLSQHPDLYFDLITIDGAKSVLSVASDFANALPRLKIGGIVVTDDLPVNPVLRRIWERVIERDGRYTNWEFIDANVGVAAAIRVADAAPVVLAPLKT